MTTDLKTGDYVEVPKGTTVYDRSSAYSLPNPLKDTSSVTSAKRVVKVEVTELFQWVNDADPTDIHHYHPGRYSDKTYTRTSFGEVVIWSKTKWTNIANVTKVDAPVKKEREDTGPKAPTIRQLMAKGTKWKLTVDAKLVKEGSKYNDLVDDGVIPAGTEIEIVDKMTNYGPSWVDGLWVPCAFPGWKRRLVAFKELNQNPEQIGVTESTPVFYIWDKATQQYYAGEEYLGYDGSTSLRSWGIKYVDRLTKAKKFNRLADVRAHVLVKSGYYDDLPESWGSIPEWMNQGKSFDIPDTWEIVKIDKLSKTELDRIEIQDTFKRSWRLRGLTVKFGSAVRSIYSDLEKKGKLKEFSAVMVFAKETDDKYYWDQELTAEERAEIKECFHTIEKSDMKFGSGLFTQAVGFKDVGSAVMARLMYSGKLKCQVIDLEKLEEVANESSSD